MRRLLLAAALLSPAACFAPRPCTMALCPSAMDGTYRVTGWNRSVNAGGGAPFVPIVSDSDVEITGGSVAFTNGTAVVRASEGTSFRFELSTAVSRGARLLVSSGSVSVALSSGAAASLVPAGSSFLLPVAK
ncbi:MAG: hypothetical protein KGL74_10130 [Elusimicrobia bacterium]|nr:hypothetical protein [Elusimicrobiota bacterium]MDE2511470.1 hypothetical protein [Elusimicrobiota bacterium]